MESKNIINDYLIFLLITFLSLATAAAQTDLTVKDFSQSFAYLNFCKGIH